MQSLHQYQGLLFFASGIILNLICLRIEALNRVLTQLQILEHEVTHAITSISAGGRLHSLSISQSGGSVTVTQSSFIVRIAPYCFSLFCISILFFTFLFQEKFRTIGGITAGFFFGNYLVHAFACIGRQSDIRMSGGRLIAYPVILIVNIAVLAAIGHMLKGL